MALPETPARRTRTDDGALWAITSYYNPVGYRRRRQNYRAFVTDLKVPLIAVELGFDGRFDLHEGDADILIQFSRGDVMWQKERLLNLALARLPKECRFVAWIDCDVVFDNEDWPERTVAALDRFGLVQLFDHAHHMPPAWTPDSGHSIAPILARAGIASALASGMSAVEALRSFLPVGLSRFSNGFAWAARRDLMEAIGLYDECILGGGDKALVSAAAGDFDYILQGPSMHDLQKPRYLDWATSFKTALGSGVGAVEGLVRHLWHGDLERRRITARYAGLLANAFDPAFDLSATQEEPWRWNSPKPELHEYVASYFVSRQEDG